jgi:hypothetical protein
VRAALITLGWIVAWPLLMLALGTMLAGCAGNVGGAQFVFGQSDTLSCGGTSTIKYGDRISVICDGELRLTTGGALSDNAVGGIEAAARGAARGAAGAVAP